MSSNPLYGPIRRLTEVGKALGVRVSTIYNIFLSYSILLFIL
jgi:hypothetical protein